MLHSTGLDLERHSKVRLLLTAAEAYPEFERMVLTAEREIWASFRIFDPRTRLRSSAAKRIGKTWFDLIVHTLQRGVEINLVIADFDPVVCADLHRGTWRSVRMLLAAAEVAGPAARLTVTPAMHPARAGLLPGLIFRGRIRARLRETVRRLNRRGPADRAAALRDMPGLAAHLRIGPGGRVAMRPGALPLPHPATHHQKIAVIDRKRLYIGGLDLDERRFDTPDHHRPGEETWHDVQLTMEGLAVAEAQAHLESFLDVTAGRREPRPQRRLLRTLSRPRRPSIFCFGPEPLRQEIATAHAMLARRAERLIYIETQFFRDQKMAQILAGIGREKPDLGMILILPGAPEDVAFEANRGLDARYGEFLQARALRRLKRAFGPRLFVGGAAQPRPAAPTDSLGNGRKTLDGAPIIYIHAKVSIFDERAAILSSANLNARSLRWDTESGVFLNTPQDVAAVRHRVMAHWLPRDAEPALFGADAATVAGWRRLAVGNAALPPAQRRGLILPYDIRAAERFGRNLPGVPPELV